MVIKLPSESYKLLLTIGIFGPTICDKCERENKDGSKHRLFDKGEWRRICRSSEYRATEPDRIPCQAGLLRIVRWQFGDKGIMAVGETGSGKTRSIFMLIKNLLHNGAEIIAMTHSEFAYECARHFEYGDGPKWLVRLETAEIIFIDELGNGKFTESVEDALFNLIEKRTSNGKPIFIATQYTGDSLIGRMISRERGEAIARRLSEYCEIVQFEIPKVLK